MGGDRNGSGDGGFSDDLPPVNVKDSGNEVSMSIEETNKLRISLGLKPLSLEPSKPRKVETKPEAPKGPSAQDIKDRIAEAKAKRKEQELRAVKGLGEADEEDDVFSWVNKIKPGAQDSDEKPQQHLGRKRHAPDDDEEEEDDQKLSAEELAALKVRHDYGEMVEGESMVLTLADRGILDERGELVEDDQDELENVLKAEDKRRKKARDASEKKAKPLFEEDGKRRSLLDKYDEEEEHALGLGHLVSEAAQQEHKEDVRRKLAEAASSILGERPEMGKGADFLTKEEVAQFTKPKRKKKKLREKPKPSADDEEGGAGGLDLDALEAEAAAKGNTDLGSRAERAALRERQEREEAERAKQKAARFEVAVEKANWASQALKEVKPNTVIVGDEADAELERSLERARRMAQLQQTAAGPPTSEARLKELADEVTARRKAQEEAEAANGDLLFTDTSEFVRNIRPQQEAAKQEEEDDGYMGVGGDGAGTSTGRGGMASTAPQKKAKRGGFRKTGGWITAEDADEMEVDGVAAEKDEEMEEADGEQERKPPELQEPQLITDQKLVGRGLAAALSLLQDTGALREKLEWAGRTNDKKKNKLEGLDDVYTGGAHEDRLARDIEVALTQRDQFGRILTPKERFREMSYKFHGMAPSKNKIEKKVRKAREEIATKQAATSENPSAQLDYLKQVQQQQGVPYVVLSGPKIKAEPSSLDPRKKHKAPKARDVSKGGLTPMLGGGMTPLTDPTKKVEAMYGIKKPPKPPGGSSAKK